MDHDFHDRTISPSRPRSRLSSEYSGASTAQPVEWQDDWISREEEFRDTINALQYEQERIQKKTFTNWINAHLHQHPQKWVVNDLFLDLKDGRILLALIEVITGDRLPCETFRHYTRAHYLSNVERALDYLRDHQIKLVNINSSDIVDGNETVILGLIWSIILNFQIDQDLAHLRENFLLSPLPSGAQSASYDARSRSVSPSSTSAKKPRLSSNQRGRFQAGASKAMLKWCQKEISERYGIPVVNLNTSWKNGMAFLGLVKVLDPSLVNLNDYAGASAAQRMNSAFSLADERLRVPRLLDVGDIDVDRPDERSIMTYIAQFVKRFPEAKARRQKMLMENLPDVEAIEAVERAEFERIRDWCSDSLTLLKCMEYTDDRPFEAYEDYKRFQQLFRSHISAYARLKEQFEEGRTLHVSESNIAELDSIFAKVLSEKHIWHRHLFEVLQGHERNFCHGRESIESELDQRALIPPHRGSNLSISTLEFRVQKYEDMMANLGRLQADLDNFLRHEEVSEAFAWHTLPSEVNALMKDVDRRLLATRCKLIIRRQLIVVDEWEARIVRWQELLRSPTNHIANMERLGYEYDLHVVQEKIFDAFLDLSKQLQGCLERLHEDSDAVQHERAAFLSTAVNSNRRWKRIAEELHRIREEVRRFVVEQDRKGKAKLEVDNNGRALPTNTINSSSPIPYLSLSPTSPTSPQPLYFKSEKWSLYLQMLGAFSRWLDRMERDFESVDRENVNRLEYQAALQRFRALCTEVVEHKSDGQAIIDTFYTCSSDLPPNILAEETRKINRLIRRYDALIPSLEVVRSEVEHSTIHSHQIINTHKEVVELVPNRPESVGQEQNLRVVTPARNAQSPTVSVATSGYATPEIETSLLRRSQPTTPSEFVNRSPPFNRGAISSQSSINEGSPINEAQDLHDIDMEDSQRSVSKSPADDRPTMVRNIEVRGGGAEGPSAVQRARAVFSARPDLSSDDEEEVVKRRKMDTAVPQKTSEGTMKQRIVPVDMGSSKISALKSAFENAGDKSKGRLKPGGMSRKSRSSTSSSSSSNSDEERKKRSKDERKKQKKEAQEESTSSTTVGPVKKKVSRGGTEVDERVPVQDFERHLEQVQSQLMDASRFQPHLESSTGDDALLSSPTQPAESSSDSSKKQYLRNVKTTTLVTSTETKTVKTTVVKSPSREALAERLAVFSESPQEVAEVTPHKVSVGKLQSPFVDSDKKSSRESLLSTSSSGEGGRVRAKVNEFSKARSGSEEGLVDKPVKAEKPTTLGPLRTKTNTKTEFEETSQTVKRTVLSPVLPSREKLFEKSVVETTPVSPVTPKDTKTMVRNVSFDDGIKPVIRSSSVDDSSSSPQRVIITPYTSSSKQASEMPKSALKANRMIDLFEKGASNPELFVEQIPEPTAQRVFSPERPVSHVSMTSPFQLAEEASPVRPLSTYEDEDIQLTEPVSQRINRYKEIVSSPSTTTTNTLPSFEPPQRRPVFNTFVQDRFIKETQSPTREEVRRLPTETFVRTTEITPRGSTETIVRTTEVSPNRPDSEERSAGLAGSFYNVPVRSAEKETKPLRAEEKLAQKVVETKVTPVDKVAKPPSEVLRQTKEKKKAGKVPHFTSLSDKQFETRMFASNAADTATEMASMASMAPSLDLVGGRVKLFERMQGIEYAKPADMREGEIMSTRSSDTVFSASKKPGALSRLLPLDEEEEEEAAAARSRQQQQKRVTIKATSPQSSMPPYDLQMSPVTGTVRSHSSASSVQSQSGEADAARERPSQDIEHRTGFSDSRIDFVNDFVRDLNENRRSRKEEVLPGQKEWQNREVLQEMVLHRDQDRQVRRSASPPQVEPVQHFERHLEQVQSQPMEASRFQPHLESTTGHDALLSSQNHQVESLSEHVRNVDAGTEVKVSSWLDDTVQRAGESAQPERQYSATDGQSFVGEARHYITTTEAFAGSPVMGQHTETYLRDAAPTSYRPVEEMTWRDNDEDAQSLTRDVTESMATPRSVQWSPEMEENLPARSRHDLDVEHFVGGPDRDISELDSRYEGLKRRISTQSPEEASPRRSRIEKYEDVRVEQRSPSREEVSTRYGPSDQGEARQEAVRQVRRDKYEAVTVQRIPSTELLTENVSSRPTSVLENRDVQYQVSPGTVVRTEEYIPSKPEFHRAESSEEIFLRSVGGKQLPKKGSRENLEETVVRSISPSTRDTSAEDRLSRSGLRDIRHQSGLSDQRIESFITSHRSRPAEETTREGRPVSQAISFVRDEAQPDQASKRPKTEKYKQEEVSTFETPQHRFEVSPTSPIHVREVEPFNDERIHVREVEPIERFSETVTTVRQDDAPASAVVDAETGVPFSKLIHVREVEPEVTFLEEVIGDPRQRSPAVEHRFGMSDQDVEEALSRPVFVRDVSETDLAPKRRASATAIENQATASESVTSTATVPEQAYPWESPTVSPTVIREEETTQRREVPQRPIVNVPVTSETVIRQEEPSSSRSRNEASTSSSSEEAPAKERKKSGFLGLFSGSKKEKSVKSESIKSSSSKTSLVSLTSPANSTSSRKSINTEQLPTPTVVRQDEQAVENKQRAEKDSVSDLLYGRKEPAEEAILQESIARHRPTSTVVHHVSEPDSHAENYFSTRERVVMPERRIEEVEEAERFQVIHFEPHLEAGESDAVVRSPSRQMTKSPSFIPFEQSTITTTQSPSKKPLKGKKSQESTQVTSRSSTPSPSRSSNVVEEYITERPGDFSDRDIQTVTSTHRPQSVEYSQQMIVVEPVFEEEILVPRQRPAEVAHRVGPKDSDMTGVALLFSATDTELLNESVSSKEIVDRQPPFEYTQVPVQQPERHLEQVETEQMEVSRFEPHLESDISAEEEARIRLLRNKPAAAARRPSVEEFTANSSTTQNSVSESPRKEKEKKKSSIFGLFKSGKKESRSESSSSVTISQVEQAQPPVETLTQVRQVDAEPPPTTFVEEEEEVTARERPVVVAHRVGVADSDVVPPYEERLVQQRQVESKPMVKPRSKSPRPSGESFSESVMVVQEFDQDKVRRPVDVLPERHIEQVQTSRVNHYEPHLEASQPDVLLRSVQIEDVEARQRPMEVVQHRVNIRDDFVQSMDLPLASRPQYTPQRSSEDMREVVTVGKIQEPAESTVVQTATAKESPKQHARSEEEATRVVTSEKERKKSKSGILSMFKRRNSKDTETEESASRSVVFSEERPEESDVREVELTSPVVASEYVRALSVEEVPRERPTDVAHFVAMSDARVEEALSRFAPVEVVHSEETVVTTTSARPQRVVRKSVSFDEDQEPHSRQRPEDVPETSTEVRKDKKSKGLFALFRHGKEAEKVRQEEVQVQVRETLVPERHMEQMEAVDVMTSKTPVFERHMEIMETPTVVTQLREEVRVETPVFQQMEEETTPLDRPGEVAHRTAMSDRDIGDLLPALNVEYLEEAVLTERIKGQKVRPTVIPSVEEPDETMLARSRQNIVNKEPIVVTIESRTQYKPVETITRTFVTDQEVIDEHIVPRERPDVKLVHGGTLSDADFERFSQSGKYVERAENVPDKEKVKEFGYESVTTARVSDRETDMATVAFGVSERQKLAKDVFDVQPGAMVASAKFVPAVPQEFVSVREVVTTENIPRTLSPSVNSTSILVSRAEEFEEEPRVRPDRIHHRVGGPSDLLVTHDLVEKSPVEEHFDESVIVTSTKKARPVVVTRQESADDELVPHERHMEQVEGEETVILGNQSRFERHREAMDTPTTVTHIHEEVVVHRQEKPRQEEEMAEARSTSSSRVQPVVFRDVIEPEGENVAVVESEVPRERPDGLRHRVGGPSDFLVTHNWVEKAPVEEHLDESVTIASTQKARPVLVTRHKSSEEGFLPTHEQHMEQVEGEETVILGNQSRFERRLEAMDTPTTVTHIHEEVVVYRDENAQPEQRLTELIKSPTMVSGMTDVWDDARSSFSSRVQSEVFHDVIEPDMEEVVVVVVEEEFPRPRPDEVAHHVGWRDADNEELSPVGNVETLTEKVVVVQEAVDVRPGKAKKGLERLSTTTKPEVIVYSIDDEVKREKVTVEERVRETDLSRERNELLVERTDKVKLSGLPADARRYRAPEIQQEEEEEEPTVIRSEFAETITVVEEPKIEKPRMVAVEQRQETLVREPTVSEATTASVSQTGSRSKTPDSLSGTLKSKSVKTMKQKVPKVKGSNKTKEFSYEDVVYWKTAKGLVSPDYAAVSNMDTRTRTATPATVLPEQTVLTEYRQAITSRPVEETIIVEKPTETQVREVGKVKSVTRQKMMDSEKVGKSVVKKQHSRSSSSSSSEREEVEEISSVTINKAKFTNPTPEPRDEVQLALAEMKTSYNEEEYQLQSSRRQGPLVVEETVDQLAPLKRNVTVEEEEVRIREDRRKKYEAAVDERPMEFVMRSRLATPYERGVYQPTDTVSQTIVREIQIRPSEETIMYSENIVEHEIRPTQTYVRPEEPQPRRQKSIERREQLTIHQRHMEQDEGQETAIFSQEGRFERHMEGMDNPSTVTYVRHEERRDVAAHRDSESGLALIERSKTDQLPTYISFGTLEPDSYHSPPAEIVSGDIEVRQRPDVTLRHATGPRDDTYEQYQKEVRVVTTERSEVVDIPLKPSRRSLEDSPLERTTETIMTTTVVPQLQARPARRQAPPINFVETTETVTRPVVVVEGREAVKTRRVEEKVVVEPGRTISPSTNSSVSLNVENEEVVAGRATASPETMPTSTYSRSATVQQKPAVAMQLAPTRSRSAMSGSRSATLSSPGEYVEEHVEHIRVKFREDMEPKERGRPKTPNHHNALNNLFVGHEEVNMRTSSRQGDYVDEVMDESRGRSVSRSGKTLPTERLAPLATARTVGQTTTVVNERSVDLDTTDVAGEPQFVRTHSERLGISSPPYQRDETSPASRAGTSTPAPLGLPYPDTYRLQQAQSAQWQTEVNEAGYPIVSTDSQRLGISAAKRSDSFEDLQQEKVRRVADFAETVEVIKTSNPFDEEEVVEERPFEFVRTDSERLGISPSQQNKLRPDSRHSVNSFSQQVTDITARPFILPGVFKYEENHAIFRTDSQRLGISPLRGDTEVTESIVRYEDSPKAEVTSPKIEAVQRQPDISMTIGVESLYHFVRSDSERLGISPRLQKNRSSTSLDLAEETVQKESVEVVEMNEQGFPVVRSHSKRLGISRPRSSAEVAENVQEVKSKKKAPAVPTVAKSKSKAKKTSGKEAKSIIETDTVLSTSVEHILNERSVDAEETLFPIVRTHSERLGISPRLHKDKSSTSLDLAEETVAQESVEEVELNELGFPVVRTHSRRLGISRPGSSTEVAETVEEVKSKKKAPAAPTLTKSKSKSKKTAETQRSIIGTDTVVFTSVEHGSNERSVDAEETPFPIVRTHSERLGINRPKETSMAHFSTPSSPPQTTQIQRSSTLDRLNHKDEHKVVRTHSVRLGISTPKREQDTAKIEQVKDTPEDSSLKITRRVIETHSSPEEQAMVVETFRRAALSSQSPDVDELEYWTSSGRSSSGDLKERVLVKGGTINRFSNISDTPTYTEIPSRWSQEVKSQVQPPPPTGTIVVNPISVSIKSEGPIYAKVNKKKKGKGKESLEEDVFYWKILNRKKAKSYSAERIRSHSPQNNLTLQEMAILARSINSLPFDELDKAKKGATITKSRTKRRTKSSSELQYPQEGRVSSASPFDDSGAFSGREDLQLTSTLDKEGEKSARKASPFTKARHLTVDESMVTSMKTRSFSPSSNDALSGASSSGEYVDGRARGRERLLESVDSETMERSADDDVDRQYRRAMKEPLPDQHSCLPAYNRLHYSVNQHLLELQELIADPDCQYIDMENLQLERHRFTALLDGLVRVNKDLDRLDDLYRAMINVEPEAVIWEAESRQREVNRLYMDQLGYLKHILRRVKHLEMLLEQYKRRRLQFKVHLLEELTFFRTHDNMAEDEQKERVEILLDEVLTLRAVTYKILVRCSPSFAVQLEEELYDILMLLRTELSGSIIQLLQTGQYSVQYDATLRRLSWSSEELMSDTATTSSRANDDTTVWKVLRRALPMQALALILLGFASLIPMTDDEFSCLFSNYFASSFNPALKFTGPPPI